MRTKEMALTVVAAAALISGGYALGHNHRSEAPEPAPVTELPASMNPDRAAAAAEHGSPFAVSAGTGGADCRIWVRFPDASVWSMPPLRYVNLTGTRLQQETDPGAATDPAQCGQGGPAASSGTPDPAAQAAATAAGVPYVAAVADPGGPDGCHVWLTGPAGKRWGIDTIGLGDGGRLLSGDVREFRCSGYTLPPGQ